MGKLYTIKKPKNLLSLHRNSSLERLFQKGLINEKSSFLSLDFDEWESFAQFVFRLEKDLKKTRNVTLLILSSALVIEGALDLIFIKIYKLDKYRRVGPFDLLSKISFHHKIELVKKLKKSYPRKQPKRKEYTNHFSYSLSFLRELKKKYGEKVLTDMENINDTLNKQAGIQPPPKNSIEISTKKTPDYLPDDIVALLKKMNITEIERIKELRNIVSHNWKPKENIAKNLRVKKSKLDTTVRTLCLNVINNLLGLKIK